MVDLIMITASRDGDVIGRVCKRSVGGRSASRGCETSFTATQPNRGLSSRQPRLIQGWAYRQRIQIVENVWMPDRMGAGPLRYLVSARGKRGALLVSDAIMATECSLLRIRRRLPRPRVPTPMIKSTGKR